MSRSVIRVAGLAGVVVFVGCVVACGATVVITPDDDSDGAGGASGSCEVAGVRLCGVPGCEPLEFEACPGLGCTPAVDRDTGEPLAVGVCWPDLPGWPARSCFACDEGEACIHRTADELSCVPIEVCAELYARGFGSACRYSDKSAYTGEAVPSLPTCPTTDYGICGGDCQGCGAACGGRSPLHPWGVCTDLSSTSFVGCGLTAGGPVEPACISTWPLCAVWAVGPQDQPVADRFGVCLTDDSCKEAATALQGGIRCYDASGAQVY